MPFRDRRNDELIASPSIVGAACAMVDAPIFQASQNIVVGRETSKPKRSRLETIQDGDSNRNRYDSLPTTERVPSSPENSQDFSAP